MTVDIVRANIELKLFPPADVEGVRRMDGSMIEERGGPHASKRAEACAQLLKATDLKSMGRRIQRVRKVGDFH